MDIRNLRALKQSASERLEHAGIARKLILILAGILVGSSALVTVVNYLLGMQISQSGGLSNLGLRSFLSTVRSVLPMVQSALMMCLELGYLAAMLRIARGQYTSTQTLRLGFDRFWSMLRCSVLQACIYFAVGILSFYVAVQIYMLTPLSAPAMEILTPLLEQYGSSMDFLLDEAVYNSLVQAMIPMFILFGLLYCLLALPVAYSYRMVNYVIIEKPGMGAMAILRASKRMMRGNRLALLKLDLSYWWYYGLSLLASIICHGDALLPMVGISLPIHEDVAYFLFYAAFLAAQFGIYCLLRNRVEVTYAQVYESVRPKETENGVVLGNIFQM